MLRLGTEKLAGAHGKRNTGQARQWWAKVPAADCMAVLRQRTQNSARRHHKATAGPAEAGGRAGTNIGEMEGHVGQNQDHAEKRDQTGKQGGNHSCSSPNLISLQRSYYIKNA